MVNPKQLAKRLLELRKRRELTQEGLAEAAGVSCKTIHRLEQGNIKPSLVTLDKLAEALGLSTGDLLGDHLETSHEVALLYSNLPPLEQQLAYVVLRTLTDHVAAARR
jgi:transcriptional regulator with XRE-family HTH domain